MKTRITEVVVSDLRFPTSRSLDGSDAMNPDPDYSAAYVVLKTDRVDGLEGHGLAFTIGRGNEVVCAAIEACAFLVRGCFLEDFTENMGAFWRRMTGDSQLRWIGPEKGVIHLATAALVNAVWDLWAKTEGKPLWKLVADFTAEEWVRCIDFRYLTDVITPEEAFSHIEAMARGKQEREERLRAGGYPAYTTSAGWLGYDDAKVRRLCREAVAQGWDHFKIKVGRDLEDDRRRCRVIREEIGWGRKLMVDANQVWDVPEAIAWMKELLEFKPWWIEEPTSPDDVVGHAAIAKGVFPVGVATGEHAHNRLIFKQLMQLGAIRFCQVDACRLGGVNEVLAVMLMAAKFGIPVCPHAGGVGLCEHVQHLSMIDYLVISGTMDDRVIEYVDHLHEHFVNPVVIRNGRYLVPEKPGYSTEIKQDSRQQYRYPDGVEWAKK